MSLLGGVGAPQHPLPVQTSIKPNTGSFLGRAVNWIKRTLDRAGYVNDRITRANDLFNQLKNTPEYGEHLANLATPELGRAFRSTRPFSEIASTLREYAGAVRDYNTRRAAITDALAEDPNLDLSDDERAALAQRVQAEPRWGTPGNDLTRLVNEHRADQLSDDGRLSAIVAEKVDESGLPEEEMLTAPFVHDLRNSVIPKGPHRLTPPEAEARAQKEAADFCRDKKACLDRFEGPFAIDPNDGVAPYRDQLMRNALRTMVLNDPGMRSADNLEHVLRLAHQMDTLIGPLFNAPTRKDQIKAHDAFARACQAAGLTRPEEQEAFLARAFQTWVGGLTLPPQDADRFFTGLPRSLKHQHAALTREINFAKAQAQSEQQVDRDQPTIGLDRFLECLADAAERAPGSMPTLSKRQSGAFSPVGIQALQDDLNGMLRAGPTFEVSQDLRALQRPDSPLSEQFLKDIVRGSEYTLGGASLPGPGDGAGRVAKVHEFFGDDEPGKQAVTLLANQTIGNSLRKRVMPSLYGPFQAGVTRNAQDERVPEIPTSFEIRRTDDHGYRVKFTSRTHAHGLEDQVGRTTELDAPNSWLELKGEFEISRASIDRGQPSANVTSLNYDYQFHPATEAM